MTRAPEREEMTVGETLRAGLARYERTSEFVDRAELRNIENEIDLIEDDPDSFPPEDLAAFLGVEL